MDKIIEERKKRKLTQTALAEKLGYHRNTVANWERGRKTPSLEAMEAMSAFFNLPIESLLNDKKRAG
ncbi:MAG: helix-turn-helix domain-containing protein [Coriobacteriia bacterium]|nr:helix-turn-helix domain-containing protein [Coriobacteriia bacterium]